MSEKNAPNGNGAMPKLTLGQRMLTVLPSLQRAPRPGPTPGSGTATRNGAGEADASVEDAVAASEATTPSGSDRVRNSLIKPADRGQRSGRSDPTAGMSKEEIVKAIKTLDDRERFLALFAGPLGAAVGIALTAVGLHLNPALHHKNHVSAAVFWWEGGARVLLGGVVVAAAYTRRRSFVGFALLFLGTAMGSPLFALPFWALGGWLIWRVFRMQKALTARGGSPPRGRAATTGPRGSGSPRASASTRTAARGGAAAARTRAQERRRRKTPEPAGPAPSKRYTPPKPTRPRPPAPSE